MMWYDFLILLLLFKYKNMSLFVGLIGFFVIVVFNVEVFCLDVMVVMLIVV